MQPKGAGHGMGTPKGKSLGKLSWEKTVRALRSLPATTSGLLGNQSVQHEELQVCSICLITLEPLPGEIYFICHS